MARSGHTRPGLMARSVRMPASRTAPNPTARSPIRVRASPMPASAKARRRAGDYGDAPRPARFNRDDRPARSGGDRPDRGPRKDFRPRDDQGGEKRPYTPREGGEKRPYAARGDRSDARPADGFPTRNSATNGPIHRAVKVARNGPTRRVARDSARTVTVRAATGPNGNSEATRNFRAARRIAARARISAAARIAANSKPWQKRDASSPDHAGRNSRPARDGARNFDRPNFDKPRFDKPRDERGGDERPRFSSSARRPSAVRSPTVRPAA